MAFVGLVACSEQISTDPSLSLSFSTDTIRFDTIFSGIESTTAQIRVRNDNKKAILLDQVALAGGNASQFRLNIDGMSNADSKVQNITIPAKDSIFIFVEVTAQQTNQNAPLVIRDSIVFAYNGKVQQVQLEAYGQDMEILRDRFIANDTTLTADLPYLVYGALIVDSAKTLTLEPGCRLYFHRGAQLIVGGNLIVNGTLEQPVTMKGDRLDDIFVNIPYDYVDGQWGGILLPYTKAHHQLSYLEINSGYSGIIIMGTRDEQPTLEMENCRIHNFSLYGLAVENANVTSVNTEISNCAGYCLYLAGGEHTFIHNTIANYFSKTTIAIHSATREDQVSVCINDVQKTAPMHSEFVNCIISGTRQEEFGLYTQFQQQYLGNFHHNLIQSDSIDWPQFSANRHIQPSDYILQEGNKLFRNISYIGEDYYDFRLDSASLARDWADVPTAEKYSLDRLGNNRMADGKPDLGAYEYVNGTEE